MNAHQLQADSPAQERALKLLVVLSRASAAVQSHLQASVAEFDLTLMEFGILEALYHRGDMLLGELQRKILVSSGGVTYLVDRLEKRGLVERRDSPEDRRARFAVLTAEGEALISRVFPEHARCIERALDGLDAEEQETAIGLLRTLGRYAADQERCGEKG